MFLQEQFQGLCLTCRSNSPDIQYTIKSNAEYIFNHFCLKNALNNSTLSKQFHMHFLRINLLIN